MDAGEDVLPSFSETSRVSNSPSPSSPEQPRSLISIPPDSHPQAVLGELVNSSLSQETSQDSRRVFPPEVDEAIRAGIQKFDLERFQFDGTNPPLPSIQAELRLLGVENFVPALALPTGDIFEGDDQTFSHQQILVKVPSGKRIGTLDSGYTFFYRQDKQDDLRKYLVLDTTDNLTPKKLLLFRQQKLTVLSRGDTTLERVTLNSTINKPAGVQQLPTLNK